MIGALSPTFQASGELWLNDRRIDSLPTAQRQIGILFRDALLFDHFSVGQNLLLALPASLKGSARRDKVERALERAGLAGFIIAIRRHSPAGNDRVSPCCARCWHNRRRCCWMNPSADWTPRFATRFASGSLPKCASWVFPWCRLPMTRRTFRPRAAFCRWQTGRECGDMLR